MEKQQTLAECCSFLYKEYEKLARACKEKQREYNTYKQRCDRLRDEYKRLADNYRDLQRRVERLRGDADHHKLERKANREEIKRLNEYISRKCPEEFPLTPPKTTKKHVGFSKTSNVVFIPARQQEPPSFEEFLQTHSARGLSISEARKKYERYKKRFGVRVTVKKHKKKRKHLVSGD